jgi:hypothetical protein
VWVDDDHVLTASGAKVYTHSLRVYSSIVAHVLTLSSSCHVSYKVADVNRKVRECALNTPVDGPTKVAGFITATTILNTTTSVRLFLFFGLCVCRSFFLSIFVSVLFFSLSLCVSNTFSPCSNRSSYLSGLPPSTLLHSALSALLSPYFLFYSFFSHDAKGCHSRSSSQSHKQESDHQRRLRWKRSHILLSLSLVFSPTPLIFTFISSPTRSGLRYGHQ